jgi:hypothetical protein
MEPPSAALQRKPTELQKLLEETGIAATLTTIDAGDIDGSPSLPTGTSFWTRLM